METWWCRKNNLVSFWPRLNLGGWIDGHHSKRAAEIFQIKEEIYKWLRNILEKIKLFKKYGRLGKRAQKTHLGIDMRCTQVTAPVFWVFWRGFTYLLHWEMSIQERECKFSKTMLMTEHQGYKDKNLSPYSSPGPWLCALLL